MEPNQPPWPRYWLMTDERIGERLRQAIDALPDGRAGIVFRHYRLAPDARLDLGRQVAATARERGLVLAVAGSRDLAEALDAALVHNPDRSGELAASIAVHDEREALAARHAGAALAFIAPVHATRSHPEAAPLGPDRAGVLARLAGCPSIALGGMDEVQFGKLQAATSGAFYGYAGIDCWLRT